MTEGSLGVKDCERLQIQREVRCAVNLAAVLRRFTTKGDETAFRVALEAEVSVLASAPFGEELCHTIGFTYVNKADQWCGFNQAAIAKATTAEDAHPFSNTRNSSSGGGKDSLC